MDTGILAHPALPPLQNANTTSNFPKKNTTSIHSWMQMLNLLRIIQYNKDNKDVHNRHTHSSLWAHVHKSYLYEQRRRTEPTDHEIHEVTVGVSLSTGASPTTKNIAPLNHGINLGKRERLCQVEDLPGWVGSTTRNPTSWSMISSLQMLNLDRGGKGKRIFLKNNIIPKKVSIFKWIFWNLLCHHLCTSFVGEKMQF
jgi:hypothetical protein